MALLNRVGLPEKEFCAILDEYLLTGEVVNGTEAYVQMSRQQKDIMQAIKKAFKRIKYDQQ